MKKSLILGILGLAVGVATSYGQGIITLDTYFTSSSAPGGVGSDLVSYSAGLGGGLVGAGANLYVGLYYSAANQNITGSVLSDASGTADPTTLGAFSLSTGSGAVVNDWTGGGYFFNQLNGAGTISDLIQPSGATQNSYTLMVVVYNNVAGYDESTIRGHSAAFYMPDGAAITANSGDVGAGGMTSFSVNSVPEPTTLALGGLGLASLLAFRRKKA